MQGKFRVGVTSDVGDKDSFKADHYGIEVLDEHDGIEWELMEGDSNPLTPDDVRDYDALLVFGSRVSADTLAGAGRPPWWPGSESATTRSTSRPAPKTEWH